jgi:hypothetical protein
LKKIERHGRSDTGAHSGAQVEIWTQDEARLGLQPIIRRVWARHQHRPLARCSYKRQSLYLYAFVHPASGQTEWLIVPGVCMDVMSLILPKFAQAVGANARTQIVLVYVQVFYIRSAHFPSILT